MRPIRPVWTGAVVAAWVLPLLIGMVWADAPAGDVKAPGGPPWQRLLVGDDARQAEAQDRQLTQLQEAGKLEDALKTAEALVAFRTKLQGADHWETVSAYWRAEAVRRALRQGDNTRKEFVNSFTLYRQAYGLKVMGRYKELQPLCEKLLVIRRTVLGEEHPDTAQSYSNLADTLTAQANHTDAAMGYAKALAICRKVLGEDHPHTAVTYSMVATNLTEQGKYAEAAEGFARELTIFRKVLGEANALTAVSYFHVATNLTYRWKYAEATSGYTKALAIFRRVLGEGHPKTVSTYSNLAVNLSMQGKYAEAEAGFARVLAIWRKAFGDEHPQTAVGYTNLASNLFGQGKYAAGAECAAKALAINLKARGELHAATARSYYNLASALIRQGQFAQATEGLEKALAIRRKVLGEEHPDTAQSYNTLATNLSAQDKFVEAVPHFAKALAICRNLLGDRHPQTASTYSNMAYNLGRQGKYAEATATESNALAIYRKALGEEHPDTVNNYNNAASYLNAQGKYVEAEALWLVAADGFAKARLRIAASGLERAAKTSESPVLPSLAAVLARNGKPEAAWQRFEESLARGTWDDLSARLRRPTAEQARQAEFIARLDRLDQLIEQTLTPKEPTPEQEQHRKDLLTQRRQVEDDFEAFGRHLAVTYGPAAGQVFDRAQIQAALPADTALIGWLDLHSEPKAADPNGAHWAVLLRASRAPVWMRLRGRGPGDAWTEADTRLPADLHAALQNSRSDWQPLAQRLRQQRLEPLAKHLAAGNGQPTVRHLIVLPATALAGVPVEVFADGYTVSYALSGTLHAHLRKQPKLTTQGLLALADPVFEPPTVVHKPLLPPHGVLLTMVAPGSNAAQAGLRPNDVLLRYHDTNLAGPADLKTLPPSDDPETRVRVTVWRDGKTRQMELRPGKLGVGLARAPAPQALAELRKWDQPLASRGGDEKWAPLPGTRVEVEALRRLFGTEPAPMLLTDARASEQTLYDLAQRGGLGRYRYLHFATHGEVDNRFPLRSALILSRDNLPDPVQQLVAGLPVYDGRLTAEKVLRQWNLNSELVTLSACQTALGKYERGEGFVGFAQALLLSGSRAVVLSQWQVNDAATALLMERFYQNLLGKRAGLQKPLPKAAALAEAKAWLRMLSRDEAVQRTAQLSQGVARSKGRPALPLWPPLPPAPAEAREAPPYAHPYYWAAFILIGDPD